MKVTMSGKEKECGMCGYRFAPKKKEIYTAKEPRFSEKYLSEPMLFSAVDCPRCGCQIPLAIRRRKTK